MSVEEEEEEFSEKSHIAMEEMDKSIVEIKLKLTSVKSINPPAHVNTFKRNQILWLSINFNTIMSGVETPMNYDDQVSRPSKVQFYNTP